MKEVQEFERYMGHLSEGLGHSDRHVSMSSLFEGKTGCLDRIR